jgi:hypothetical protein
MKSLLVVAEYVTVNPDGTFAMLRGGINKLTAAQYPWVFPLGFITRVVGDFGEEGRHDFRLVIIDYDGREIAKAEGAFEISSEQRVFNCGVNLRVKLERPGGISVRLIIDRQLAYDWPLQVVVASPKTAPPGAEPEES